MSIGEIRLIFDQFFQETGYQVPTAELNSLEISFNDLLCPRIKGSFYRKTRIP